MQVGASAGTPWPLPAQGYKWRGSRTLHLAGPGMLWKSLGSIRSFFAWFKGLTKSFWTSGAWAGRAQQVTAGALLLWTMAAFRLQALCCFMFLWHRGIQSLAGAPGNYYKANKNVPAFKTSVRTLGENILKFWVSVGSHAGSENSKCWEKVMFWVPENK